jgi:uncharacterized membrane protein
MTKKEWTDQRVEIIVGRLLQVGVTLSALVVLIGGLIFLVRHGTAGPDYRAFHGEPSDLRQVHKIVLGAASLHGRAIIQFGLLLLIATPIARVAFALFGFAEERDRLYMAFTGMVLAILLYSLLGTS